MTGRVKDKTVDLHANAWVYILKDGTLRVRNGYVDENQPVQVDRRGPYILAKTHHGGFKVPVQPLEIRMDFGCAYLWAGTRVDEFALTQMKAAALDSTHARMERAKYKYEKLKQSISEIEGISHVECMR